MKIYFAIISVLIIMTAGAKVVLAFSAPKAIVKQINFKIAEFIAASPDFSSMPKVELLHEGYIVREAVGDDWELLGQGEFFSNGWQIGTTNPVESDQQNQLQLVLNNSPRLKYLFFEYEILLAPENADFGQPSLSVYINDQLAFVAYHTLTNEKKLGIIDLTQYDENELKCQFILFKNSGNLDSTVAKIGNITTNAVVIGEHPMLSLLVDGELAGDSGTKFLWEQNRLGYFATSLAGISSELEYIPLFKDELLPQIQILETKENQSAGESYFLVALSDNLAVKNWQVFDVLSSVIFSAKSSLNVEHSLAFNEELFWIGVKNSTLPPKIELNDFAGNSQILEMK